MDNCGNDRHRRARPLNTIWVGGTNVQLQAHVERPANTLDDQSLDFSENPNRLDRHVEALSIVSKSRAAVAVTSALADAGIQ